MPTPHSLVPTVGQGWNFQAPLQVAGPRTVYSLRIRANRGSHTENGVRVGHVPSRALVRGSEANPQRPVRLPENSGAASSGWGLRISSAASNEADSIAAAPASSAASTIESSPCTVNTALPPMLRAS